MVCYASPLRPAPAKAHSSARSKLIVSDGTANAKTDVVTSYKDPAVWDRPGDAGAAYSS